MPDRDLYPVSETAIFVPNESGYSIYLLKYFADHPSSEMNLGLAMVPESFSGFATLHDIYDSPIRIYEYSNGLLSGKGYLFNSTNLSKGGENPSSRIQSCIEIIIEWDENTVTYDPELEIWVPTVIGHTETSQICFESSSIGGGSGGDPGSGVGGGGDGDGDGGPEDDIDLGEGASPITYYQRIDPCAHAGGLGADLNFRSNMQFLRNTILRDYESFYVMQSVGDYYSYAFGSGPTGALEATVSVPGPIAGIIHSHYDAPESLPIFSISDVQSFYELASQNLLQGNIKEAVFGVVTSQGTAYLLKIGNPSAFLSFGSDNLESEIDRIALDLQFTVERANYLSAGKSYIQANELAFLKVLENAGIVLLKSNGSFTGYSKLSNNNGNVQSSGC